ncbi:hypothetical protein J6E39_03500 [bacterium]|nr:hypothetical protein [bacterium]
MKIQRLLDKAYNLEGLSYIINNLLYDIDMNPTDYHKKFDSIIELSSAIYHKVLEVKNDIYKLYKVEEQEQLKPYLIQ